MYALILSNAYGSPANPAACAQIFIRSYWSPAFEKPGEAPYLAVNLSMNGPAIGSFWRIPTTVDQITPFALEPARWRYWGIDGAYCSYTTALVGVRPNWLMHAA